MKNEAAVDLGALLTEAVRMYEEYALLALPHPDFHQGRWATDAREALKTLGRPVPCPSPEAQARARMVLANHYADAYAR